MPMLFRSSIFSITPVNALLVFYVLFLITQPIFPAGGEFGFYTVELGFFVVVFFLMFFTILALFKEGSLSFKFDPILYFCLILLGLALFSAVDAPNKVRAFLYTGQYIPYFFLMYLALILIDNNNKLKFILNGLKWIGIIVCVLFIGGAIYYKERATLDLFLEYNFATNVCKILIYIELITCITLYRILTTRSKVSDILTGLIFLGAIIFTGSRGSYLILCFIICLALLKGGLTTRNLFLVLIGLLLCVTIVMSIGYVRERVSLLYWSGAEADSRKVTAFSRVYTNMIALKIIKENALNGVGIGNLSYFTEDAFKNLAKKFPVAIINYYLKQNIFETTTTPIKMGAELGLGGIIFFFVFYLYLYMRIEKAPRVPGSSLDDCLRGMEIFILASMAHNFIDPALSLYYTWFFIGIVLAAVRIAQSQQISYRSI